jgi:FkbH-like protein
MIEIANTVGPASDLDRLLDEAAADEIPSGSLCVKIARAYERQDDLDEAFAWLARTAEAPDSFTAWSAGGATLQRITARARPAAQRHARAAVIGSYTLSQFALMLPLAALRAGVDLTVAEGLYDQYRQELIDRSSFVHAGMYDQLVIAVHAGAAQLPRTSDAPDDDIAAEVSRWHGLWTAAATTGASIVQHNFALPPESEYGHLARGLAGSRHAMLDALNREFAAGTRPGLSIVDCDRLAASYGRDRWFDDRYWYRSKQAVALEALPLLARHTSAVMAAQLGLSRKCLVLDLDNTLWGGIVGEDGLDGIQLGSEGAGQAFVAFQEYALAMKDRGVILAVASKNNEADARDVFERHPEMRIKVDDIAVFAVNWQDKPANLRHIAATLDIGIDSLVLADDNPAERQAIRRLVPEVDVIALPRDPAGYRRALAEYTAFETAVITAEDRQRATQYRARVAIKQLEHASDDLDSFYRDLRMKAVVAPFDEPNLARIVQLMGKTNQFNLTTRRHDEAAVRAFMTEARFVTRYLKLEDRFTSHGLVALAVAEIKKDVLDIDTLLMSCRVIGRTVEDRLIADLVAAAGRAGCRTIRGTYAPSAKNAIVADLYAKKGFLRSGTDDDGTTTWEHSIGEQLDLTAGYIEAKDDG